MQGTAVVCCTRDEDSNAGYRVTLHQLEVCEVNRDCIGFANGLRDNQRVTHVDGHPVSNWEEYRDRAHGRDSFQLTVIIPYAHYYDGVDQTAFAMEFCRDDAPETVPLPPPVAAAAAERVPPPKVAAGGVAGEGGGEQHWCVHSECTESVIHSTTDLAHHEEEAHGGRQAGSQVEAEATVAEPSDRWSAVLCAAPAIAQSVRTARR